VGWFGMLSQMLWALQVVGADQTGGEFHVSGTVAVGLGGDEVVVGADANYFVGGQPSSLAGLMNSTSYGVRGVTVI
jgi:hypothetical protein